MRMGFWSREVKESFQAEAAPGMDVQAEKPTKHLSHAEQTLTHIHLKAGQSLTLPDAAWRLP